MQAIFIFHALREQLFYYKWENQSVYGIEQNLSSRSR